MQLAGWLMMRTTDGVMTMILERKDLILYFNNDVSVVRSIVKPIHLATTLSFITLLDPLVIVVIFQIVNPLFSFP